MNGDQPLLAGNQVNTYRRAKIKGFSLLEELVLNLRWSWNHGTDIIWHSLDPVLWELTKNPWVVIQTVSKEKLEKALSNPEFIALLKDLLEKNRLASSPTCWFKSCTENAPLKTVAYFSMEYMLTEALPIYSGGLGNVAGDQLKAAHDLGVPVIGIGLLYQQGYFRQLIDNDGNQQALNPYNDPGQLPISPLRKADGEWLRLEIPLPGYSLWIRTWQVQVGRVKLYLLDTNDAANFPTYRGITSELYGGNLDLRIKQEILLGIGGFRLLKALGIKPEVYHLNEGHAAFCIIERCATYMEENLCDFAEALEATRVGNLFTTHTAVIAGFDLFPPEMIDKYLGTYIRERLGISLKEFLALGRQNPENASELFNMAYLAIRGSGAVNAVSALHQKVVTHLFSGLFPRWPLKEVPVGYVTNGVHMPSWDSSESNEMWTSSCGKSPWKGFSEKLCDKVSTLSDEAIWEMRNKSREGLIHYARKRLTRDLEVRGARVDHIELSKQLFHPDVLTLGFARRFATYKRPNMLLHDPERLLSLLMHSKRPMQLLIAGKAHPKDLPGQALIRQWFNFIKRPEARCHVIFLSDYDISLTEKMVQGVDLWINTPRRPWEACGTSGMKVLVNGGLNLSELDGWWAESYTPDVGWAIGSEHDLTDESYWDGQEANELYRLLEQEIGPLFYERNEKGIPEKWISKIRNSMSTLAPKYSAARSVSEYTEKYYLPAAIASLERKSKAKEIAKWKKELKENWQNIRFGKFECQSTERELEFKLEVTLGSILPRSVRVELFFEDEGPKAIEMHLEKNLPQNAYLYSIKIPAKFPKEQYTPRVIPYYPGVSCPLELPLIAWQK